MKHTPGPWYILRGPHSRTIYSIGPISSDEYAGATWLEVSEPDANLIAIAPELLEALAYARRFLNKEDHDTDYIDNILARARGEA